MLKGKVAKQWGNAKAKQIKRRDVVIFLDDIREKAPIMANRTLAVIRRMFNFAIERDILEASPCTQVKMPSQERRKDRVLSEEEIHLFWKALNKSTMDLATVLALKMELINGQRKGEVISMRWDELDLKKTIWKILAEKSKNKKSHRVHLSKMAQDILTHSKEQLGNEIWVFPSPAIKNNVHISEMAVNKAVYRGFSTVNQSKDKKPITPPYLSALISLHRMIFGAQPPVT